MICDNARKEGHKIYLSGSGSDEIFSDYGFNGEKKFMHSNFGGLFLVKLVMLEWKVATWYLAIMTA